MQKGEKGGQGSHAGLCSTCRNDRVCAYPRRGVVVECLEFEGETMEEEARPLKAVPRPSQSDPVPRAGEPGLCSWCENNPTCVFPRSTGGVWFCEEFQ
jgi:hypothetical protein